MFQFSLEMDGKKQLQSWLAQPLWTIQDFPVQCIPSFLTASFFSCPRQCGFVIFSNIKVKNIISLESWFFLSMLWPGHAAFTEWVCIRGSFHARAVSTRCEVWAEQRAELCWAAPAQVSRWKCQCRQTKSPVFSVWSHTKGDCSFHSAPLEKKQRDNRSIWNQCSSLCSIRPVKSIIKIAELPFKHLPRRYLRSCWPAFVSHLPDLQLPGESSRPGRTQNPNPALPTELNPNPLPFPGGVLTAWCRCSRH